MEISVLNPFFYPYGGGTENVLLEIYRRLAKKHNITIISGSLKNNQKTTYDEVFGIKIIRLKAHYTNIPGAPLPFLKMEDLNKTILKEHSDIYHINNRYQYFMNNIRTIASINKKIVLTIHNSLPKNIDFATDVAALFYDKFEGRKIMHAADAITCVSKYAMDVTIPQIDIQKSSVIYNGIDYNRYKKRNKNDSIVSDIINKNNLDGFVIFNNGRLVTQKGQIYLIRAFGEFINKYDAKLLIIGNGPLKNNILHLIKKLGLENKIILTGGLREEVMPYYYNASNMFVLPSLYEPFGMALIESLSSELPTIATKIGGIPEIMQRDGLYIKPNSYIDIYKKMIYAYEQIDIMKKKSEAARKRIIKKFDWNLISKKYESLFYELTK
ncbi:MAG: glycosyltransferase family 4 protein [Candidatus Marsarchaeota archaeon]|nr:glycosyltransferase family 4 protein [Candidatus Marsarchaeota archaeon]